MISDNQ